MSKTLRVRTSAGWTTKPIEDINDNRLTAEEIDDNFLALEDADHTQNTDTILDDGGTTEISSQKIYDELIALPDIINPSLDLNFGEQTYRSYVDHLGLTSWPLVGGDSKITFERAGVGGGTYFDALGVMQQAGEDEPRIDYDPVTGECLGLLVEESRANLLTYSEDFSNAEWGKSSSSIGGDAVVVPDGSSVVCKLIEDTSEDSLHLMTQTKATAADTIHTVSIFVKAAERSMMTVMVRPDNQFGQVVQRSYNIGTVSTSGNPVTSGDGEYIDSTIKAVGNGFVRISLSYRHPTATSTTFWFMLRDESSFTYTGDGTSGLYVWGAQLEAGATVSSLIPTTTAAVTRSADLCSITGTEFSEWYRQSEWSIFAEASIFSTATGTGVCCLFRVDTGGSSADMLFTNMSTDTSFIVRNRSSSVYSGQADQHISRDGFRIGYSIKNIAGTILSADGNVPVSTEPVTLTQSMTRLLIGQYGSTHVLNGRIKRLTFYPHQLSATQLQALTR